MAQFGFNTEEVEPQEDFAPLPAGEYLVMMTGSELKVTKTGNGTYMSFTNQVLEGAYKGRIIFDRANVTAENPVAQEIGRRQISSICHAVGKPSAKESSELHNVPYIVRIVVRQDKQYGDSNEVKGYKSATGAKPAVASRPAVTTDDRPFVQVPVKPYNAGDYSSKSGPDTYVNNKPAADKGKPAWMTK